MQLIFKKREGRGTPTFRRRHSRLSSAHDMGCLQSKPSDAADPQAVNSDLVQPASPSTAPLIAWSSLTLHNKNSGSPRASTSSAVSANVLPPPSLAEVRLASAWLEPLGLERYAEVFAACGFADQQVLPLDEKDLDDVERWSGVDLLPPGHRKMLLRAGRDNGVLRIEAGPKLERIGWKEEEEAVLGRRDHEHVLQIEKGPAREMIGWREEETGNEDRRGREDGGDTLNKLDTIQSVVVHTPASSRENHGDNRESIPMIQSHEHTHAAIASPSSGPFPRRASSGGLRSLRRRSSGINENFVVEEVEVADVACQSERINVVDASCQVAEPTEANDVRGTMPRTDMKDACSSPIRSPIRPPGARDPFSRALVALSPRSIMQTPMRHDTAAGPENDMPGGIEARGVQVEMREEMRDAAVSPIRAQLSSSAHEQTDEVQMEKIDRDRDDHYDDVVVYNGDNDDADVPEEENMDVATQSSDDDEEWATMRRSHSNFPTTTWGVNQASASDTSSSDGENEEGQEHPHATLMQSQSKSKQLVTNADASRAEKPSIIVPQSPSRYSDSSPVGLSSSTPRSPLRLKLVATSSTSTSRHVSSEQAQAADAIRAAASSIRKLRSSRRHASPSPSSTSAHVPANTTAAPSSSASSLAKMRLSSENNSTAVSMSDKEKYLHQRHERQQQTGIDTTSAISTPPSTASSTAASTATTTNATSASSLRLLKTNRKNSGISSPVAQELESIHTRLQERVRRLSEADSSSAITVQSSSDARAGPPSTSSSASVNRSGIEYRQKGMERIRLTDEAMRSRVEEIRRKVRRVDVDVM